MKNIKIRMFFSIIPENIKKTLEKDGISTEKNWEKQENNIKFSVENLLEE